MADVTVLNGGSIYQICPNTQAATDWLAENVQAEPWQWMGPNLCVDQHMVEDLVQGMIQDGLEVE